MTIFEVPNNEEWREVPGTHGWYEVSSLGRIRSWIKPGPRGAFRRPRSRQTALILNPVVGKRGYRVWCHRLTGKESRLTVHTSVCQAFHGPQPFEGAEVRHLNGDPLDNRAENLQWGTSAENAADRVRHGTSLAGERNPFAKLTSAKAAQIRALYGDKWLDIDELAQEFGVTPQSIRNVINRKTWKEVS